MQNCIICNFNCLVLSYVLECLGGDSFTAQNEMDAAITHSQQKAPLENELKRKIKPDIPEQVVEVLRSDSDDDEIMLFLKSLAPKLRKIEARNQLNVQTDIKEAINKHLKGA